MSFHWKFPPKPSRFRRFSLFAEKDGFSNDSSVYTLYVAGFFKTSYRIPRTLKETTRISSQRSLWLAFLKGCRCLWTARNRQGFEPFEAVDSASIDSDGLLCSPPLFFFQPTPASKRYAFSLPRIRCNFEQRLLCVCLVLSELLTIWRNLVFPFCRSLL